MESRFDGLSEFVSRRARVKIVQLMLDNGMTQQELAAEIGVSQQAVNKWLNPRETHPKNLNLDRIIDLAHELEEEQTRKILQDELLVFARLLSEKVQPMRNSIIVPQNHR